MEDEGLRRVDEFDSGRTAGLMLYHGRDHVTSSIQTDAESDALARLVLEITFEHEPAHAKVANVDSVAEIAMKADDSAGLVHFEAR